MNDNGMSSAYDSLSINTSRRIMEYAAYPMPEDYPDFPTHRQIAAYFDAYVDHFGFRDRIRFRTEVTHVERAPGQGWAVTLDDGTHHHLRVGVRGQRPPLGPALARAGRSRASSTARSTHAHHYKTPEGYEGKNVLVLGIGNSACDIAVETSRVSNQHLPRDAPRRLGHPQVLRLDAERRARARVVSARSCPSRSLRAAFMRQI